MAALYALDPSDDGPTLCPFALLTGTACPGCGLSRAASSVVRGDLGAALAYHPLVLLVVLWLAGAWTTAVARSMGYDVDLDQRLVSRLLMVSGVLFVAVWGIRVAAGTLPPV